MSPPEHQKTMQNNSFINSLPDQECFKNLAVVPEDIEQQSIGWECSKRLKISVSKMPSICEDMESFDSPKTQIQDSADHLSSPSEQDEYGHFSKVIEFVLGVANVRDPAQPMPPPSRFVRTRK